MDSQNKPDNVMTLRKRIAHHRRDETNWEKWLAYWETRNAIVAEVKRFPTSLPLSPSRKSLSSMNTDGTGTSPRETDSTLPSVSKCPELTFQLSVRWLSRGLLEIEAVGHIISLCVALVQRGQPEQRLTELHQANMRVQSLRDVSGLRVGT